MKAPYCLEDLISWHPLSSRERREQEERERELEAARQLEARVTEAFEAALVDRAADLKTELERLYQAELEKRVQQRMEDIESEIQRAHEEKRRVEVSVGKAGRSSRAVDNCQFGSSF